MSAPGPTDAAWSPPPLISVECFDARSGASIGGVFNVMLSDERGTLAAGTLRALEVVFGCDAATGRGLFVRTPDGGAAPAAPPGSHPRTLSFSPGSHVVFYRGRPSAAGIEGARRFLLSKCTSKGVPAYAKAKGSVWLQMVRVWAPPRSKLKVE